MQEDKIKRQSEIKELHKLGYSTNDISKVYSLSRARVWQILQGNDKSPNALLRICVMEILGDRCVVCGFTDIRALQIDHIHGRGTQSKKELGLNNPHKYYKYLLDMPTVELKKNFQILCANCNWIKRSENNEH